MHVQPLLRRQRRVSGAPSPRRAHRAVARPLAALALLASALCLTTACAASSTTRAVTPTATTEETPTPTAVPRVLYTADWSHGAGGWTLPPHWQVRDGQLVNDGGGRDPIAVPFAFTGASYAVKMHVAVITPPPASCLSLYGYKALDARGDTLYDAEINCFGTRSSPRYCVSALTAHGTEQYLTTDHIAGPNPISYTVLVRGQTVTYFPGTTALGSVTADVTLQPAQLQILDQQVQIAISDFQITTA